MYNIVNQIKKGDKNIKMNNKPIDVNNFHKEWNNSHKKGKALGEPHNLICSTSNGKQNQIYYI